MEYFNPVKRMIETIIVCSVIALSLSGMASTSSSDFAIAAPVQQNIKPASPIAARENSSSPLNGALLAGRGGGGHGGGNGGGGNGGSRGNGGKSGNGGDGATVSGQGAGTGSGKGIHTPGTGGGPGNGIHPPGTGLSK